MIGEARTAEAGANHDDVGSCRQLRLWILNPWMPSERIPVAHPVGWAGDPGTDRHPLLGGGDRSPDGRARPTRNAGDLKRERTAPEPPTHQSPRGSDVAHPRAAETTPEAAFTRPKMLSRAGSRPLAFDTSDSVHEPRSEHWSSLRQACVRLRLTAGATTFCCGASASTAAPLESFRVRKSAHAPAPVIHSD